MEFRPQSLWAIRDRLAERAAFMAALEALFTGRSGVGDGELGRTLRDLQRQYFKPPP